jgi:hypothetical protein
MCLSSDATRVILVGSCPSMGCIGNGFWASSGFDQRNTTLRGKARLAWFFHGSHCT